MTSEKTAAPAYKGNGYWATQIIGSAVLFLLFGAGSVFIASSGSGDPDSYGQSFMLGLTALLFLGCLIFLVVKARKQTAQQRAVYAWVIMQHQGSRVLYNVGGDMETMHLAGRASRRELTRADIDAIQALRPEVAYPARLPDA